MNARPTLRRREEFQRAFRKGSRAFEAFLQVRTWRRDDDGPPRLGVVIRATTIRHSVRRNRVRRLLREAFRQLSPLLPRGLDVVLVPQSEPAIDHLAYVFAVLARALQKSQVYSGEVPPLPTPRIGNSGPSEGVV